MNIFTVNSLTMAYNGLRSFISKLEEKHELSRIITFADPVLEIAEITDRIVKKGYSKALLFENTGTGFPLLINMFGSDSRIGLAFGRDNPYETGSELESLFASVAGNSGTFLGKMSSIPNLVKLSSVLPEKIRGKGPCQEIISHNPDLGIMPVLKCWPHDGGMFITLPMVHTIHPDTGSSNVGMYRMQLLDKTSTAMHWQRHKTGANHYAAWKKKGGRMPVSVTLGGDPVYTYASTAPLPENLNEYILAGFIRKKKVRLVKCITNDLYVPADADFVIEGYVDTLEELVWEGPFGDHTGFYSLADWYPRFHVTCITHRRDAVYPATIVGIPPQEDAFLAKATERIFLSPVKMAMLPEVVDFHMPDAGAAHNLVIVKINKSYPGQGMKVVSSLFGAGQMMFSKYIIVVSGDVDIRNYSDLACHIFDNLNPGTDIFFTRGPLDVLDHASENFSFGGKAGLDATVKHPEETIPEEGKTITSYMDSIRVSLKKEPAISSFSSGLAEKDIPVLIVCVNQEADPDALRKTRAAVRDADPEGLLRLVLAVDHTVDPDDPFMVAWQVLANTDPMRDHEFINKNSLFIDGTVKFFRKGGFARKWPNVVCASDETIELADRKWDSYGVGDFIESPSRKYIKLLRSGNDEISAGV